MRCRAIRWESPRLAQFVKTRSNSFHSTLEPNTEVFSKVSRSLAQFTLVNSVSTLLNKGGITCNCPKASQDFFVNQNKQASAQLLCSSLVFSRHERSEVGETVARLKNTLVQSNTHLFTDVSGTSLVSSTHHGQLKNMQNMPKPCHKHAKVHADVCSCEVRSCSIGPFRSRAQQGWVGVKTEKQVTRPLEGSSLTCTWSRAALRK